MTHLAFILHETLDLAYFLTPLVLIGAGIIKEVVTDKSNNETSDSDKEHQPVTFGADSEVGTILNTGSELELLLNEIAFVVEVGTEGCILSSNNNFKNHFFSQGDKVEGIPLWSLLDAENNTYLKRVFASVNETAGTWKGELSLKGQDGSYLCFYAYVSIKKSIGQVSYVCVAMDISQRKKMEKDLRHQHCVVLEQKEKLSASNAVKDKFFSIVAHDVKGPLNSLTSFSNLIVDHVDKLTHEDIKVMATELRGSVENLNKMLENLLEWSRSQTGTIPYYFEELQLSEVVKSSAELFVRIAENKEVELQIDVDPALTVFADNNSLSTVVRNLIANALKFTYRNGQVKVFAYQKNDCIRLAVKDTGVGIRHDVQDSLFRLDVKNSTLGTEKEKGTGLGLILCKEFITQNKGKIWVESQLGQGSTFWIELPVGKK